MKIRKSLYRFILVCFIMICIIGIHLASGQDQHVEKIKPGEAKRMLLEGNARKVSGAYYSLDTGIVTFLDE